MLDEVLAAGRKPSGLRIFANTPEGSRPAANKSFTAQGSVWEHTTIEPLAPFSATAERQRRPCI
ncbi:hypothetical protein CKO51_22770 [Rhodopirellula sp. SM50]|nr:hypothetical protein CKO51_22770 [Rhodopirellula sp. SM50]